MKDIRKLQKRLLMEELKRQGKAPKTWRWVFLGLFLLLMIAAGVVWYRANLQTRLEESFRQGLALKDAGKYAAAVELFSELYMESPAFAGSPQALFWTAEIENLYLGRYSDALLAYLLLERDYPEAAEVDLAIRRVAGLYKYRLNDCGQAIAVYQKLLEQPDPDGAQLQYEVADCYFRLNNFEQAHIEFEGLLKDFPDSELHAEVRYRIAMTYALVGKLAEAEAAYRLMMQSWSDSPYAIEARFGLATVLEEREELIEALRILEELAGIYPKQDILERKTAQVRERIAKKKEAI